MHLIQIRVFVLWLLQGLFLYQLAGQSPQYLSKWTDGYLDIHFISTGTGNCTFAILPDSTTLLIDAGEQDPTSPRVLSPRNTRRYPDYSKLGYQWQADYITSLFPEGWKPVIDIALITHYHDDHFGTWYEGIPKSTRGNFGLSGITGLGDLIPIKTLIDRGSSYPFDMRKRANSFPELYKSLVNYWNWIDYEIINHQLVHQTIEVGSTRQFRLRHNPDQYPAFRIQSMNANGIVWSKRESGNTISLMPDITTMHSEKNIPDENNLSCGILMQYGNFRFFTSGDIHGAEPTYRSQPDWYDVEKLVGPAVGEVDVATANHHANRDGMSATYLSHLKPRVIVQEVWSSDHPGHETLLRMTSREIWTDPRDLFATNMLEANRLVIGELLERSYKSLHGHIVIRVQPGGDTYMVYILNHESKHRRITGTFGPYTSKKPLP